jgi:hypothetical protein
MTVTEVLSVLRAFVPQFRVVEGYYVLVLPGLPEITPASIRQMEATFGRELKRHERDMNRCFIVANILDMLDLNRQGEPAPDDLVFIADVLAALLRDGLVQAFPDQEFQVEVIGANLVDIEPLELCVTFSRAQ